MRKRKAKLPKHVWIEVCNVDGSVVEFWRTKAESRGWRAVDTRLVKFVPVKP